MLQRLLDLIDEEDEVVKELCKQAIALSGRTQGQSLVNNLLRKARDLSQQVSENADS